MKGGYLSLQGMKRGLWLLLALAFSSERTFAFEGSGEGGDGWLLLVFAWANFLLFLFFLYLFGRKPLREYLGYRYLTLTRSLRERAEEEARLKARLQELERIERTLPEELAEERKRVYSEVEREVEHLRSEFQRAGEALRSQYRTRLLMRRKEMETSLFLRVVHALRKILEEGLSDRERALLQSRYLHLLEERRG